MLRYLLILIVVLAFPILLNAQTQDDATRDLWDTAFIKKRPAPKAPATTGHRVIRYKVVGKSSTASSKTDAGGSAVVGVTVWRLRPSKASDEAEVRQLVHDEGGWTPERVGGGTPLSEGTRVQLTIESPRAGYLYVFDREMYADKTFGDSYLIFPTTRLNGGDNKVGAGKVIEIPSADDNPPYYTLKRSRSDHEGESLTVIVSDKPLTDLTIGRTALKISAGQFGMYETRWGAMTAQLELDSGAGTAMSKAEKAAAAGKKDLTQDDLPPQTIYRVHAKPGQPLLVTIPLSISSKQDGVAVRPGL